MGFHHKPSLDLLPGLSQTRSVERFLLLGLIDDLVPFFLFTVRDRCELLAEGLAVVLELAPFVLLCKSNQRAVLRLFSPCDLSHLANSTRNVIVHAFESGFRDVVLPVFYTTYEGFRWRSLAPQLVCMWNECLLCLWALAYAHEAALGALER